MLVALGLSKFVTARLEARPKSRFDRHRRSWHSATDSAAPADYVGAGRRQFRRRPNHDEWV